MAQISAFCEENIHSLNVESPQRTITQLRNESEQREIFKKPTNLQENIKI